MKTKRKYKKNKIRKQKGGEEGFFSKIGQNLQKTVNSAKNKVPSFFGSLKNRAMGNFNSVKSKLCNMGGSKKTQKNRKKYKKHK